MARHDAANLRHWAPTTRDDVASVIGLDVWTRDGEQVGTFTAVYAPDAIFEAARSRHYFLLKPGLLKDWFGGLDEIYIPESAIAGFTGDGVWLALTEEEIKTQRCETPLGIADYQRF
jgi:hypothetical protein